MRQVAWLPRSHRRLRLAAPATALRAACATPQPASAPTDSVAEFRQNTDPIEGRPTGHAASGTALRIIGRPRAGLSTLDARAGLIEPIDMHNGRLDPCLLPQRLPAVPPRRDREPAGPGSGRGRPRLRHRDGGLG